MKFADFIKATALTVATIWLAGCASNNAEKNSPEKSGSMTKNQMQMRSDLDPAVQAVLDSGQVDASPERVEALLNQKVYNFQFDSSKLNQDDYNSLDAQVAYLNSSEGANKHIIIHGHTDERGTRTYNLALGERRGNTVKNYLVAKGIDVSRIEVISFGFEKTLDPAHNHAAWAMNRRAVINIVD